MTEAEETQRWQRFYRAVAGRAPRQVFVDALAAFEADDFVQRDAMAVDLGCGDGTETLALLASGWRVLAIDAQPAAIEHVLAAVPATDRVRLRTQVARFADALLPPADFVYAGVSLPFCPPAEFAKVWDVVTAALRPGARFAGHLFGDRDGWRDDPTMTCVTAAEVHRLLDGFVIEKLGEWEQDGRTALGDPHHWHLFEISARRQ